MRFRALVAVLGLLVACSVQPDPPDNKPRIEQIQPAGLDAPHGLELKAVDDGSTLMKELFSHVSRDRPGGVSADIDQWRTEDGTTRTDYFLTAGSREALAKYAADAAANDPTLTVPTDHELGFERLDGNRWRTYLLYSAVELDARSVAHAEVSYDPNTNRPIVLLDFTPAAARHFGDLTAKITGHKLAVLVDGTIQSAPIINSPILGGRASITMGGSDMSAQERDARALAATLGPTP